MSDKSFFWYACELYRLIEPLTTNIDSPENKTGEIVDLAFHILKFFMYFNLFQFY